MLRLRFIFEILVALSRLELEPSEPKSDVLTVDTTGQDILSTEYFNKRPNYDADNENRQDDSEWTPDRSKHPPP